jgi:DNA-directed RNA polymerase subunit K/omega
MNAELVKKALAKVLDPHVLVNMVSQRVRQLNAGNGRASNPMVKDTTNQGAADIALREIIEDKIGFDMPELIRLTRPTARGRKKPQSWAKHEAA